MNGNSADSQPSGRSSTKTVWKVLHRWADRRLISAWMSGDLMHEYHTSINNVPKLGKFFAFDSMSAAEAWLRDTNPGTMEIWEAETPSFQKAKEMAPSTAMLTLQLAQRFWSGKPREQGSLTWSVPPTGTVFCPSLKLKRKVAEWKGQWMKGKRSGKVVLVET